MLLLLILPISLTLLAASTYRVISVQGQTLEIAPGFSPASALKIENVLLEMGRITGWSTSSYFQGLIGTFNGQNLNRYFFTRIRRIDRIEDTKNSLGKTEAAGNGFSTFAYVDNSKRNERRPDTLQLAEWYLKKANIPLLHLYLNLIHEARHADPNGAYVHTRCPAKMKFAIRPLKDPSGEEGACDSGLNGAYAVQAIVAGNIRFRCADCTEKVKQDAQLLWRSSLTRLASLSDQEALMQDALAGVH